MGLFVALSCSSLSFSHRFPMGASHSASAVTVGHLVMAGLGCGSQFGGGSDLVVGEIL